MGRYQKKLRDLIGRAQSLPTGEEHVFVVSTFEGGRIEMADAHFNFDSAVLLPDEGEDAPNPASDAERITALAVLRACCLYAQDNPSQKVVVAGHTDTKGKPAYNLGLSRMRAENVRAALVGDKDAWVKTALAKHTVADRQRILRFVAFTLGWNCNPGAVDDQDGPATRAAMKGFRTRFDADIKGKTKSTAWTDKQLWQAFFDVYMLELKALMDVDDAGLASLQQGIKFVDSAHEAVGCGECHPVEGSGQDGRRSVTNRRVEILFFEPGHEPKFLCHPSKDVCKPALCEIYGGHFNIEHIPVDELLSAQQLLLEWPDDLTDTLPTDLTLVMTQEHTPEVSRPWSAGEVSDGLRRFKLEPFNPAVPCTLVAKAGGEETVLWTDQMVNDPSNPPVWEHTIEELVVIAPADETVTDEGELPPGDSPIHGNEFSF
jgi:outer membrane protein OmpA-like peptidoglycan-associated protein